MGSEQVSKKERKKVKGKGLAKPCIRPLSGSSNLAEEVVGNHVSVVIGNLKRNKNIVCTKYTWEVSR